MKNLILIRHAKSSWETPIKDHQRPLSKRGIKDAHLIAEVMGGILPKLNYILSSTAKRASETAELIAQCLNWPSESIVFDERLYTFDGIQLSKIIKSLNDGYENVIVFGHNDAITEFVNTFGDLYISNVPTCGVVMISFDVNSWSLIKKGSTINTIFPRDLRI